MPLTGGQDFARYDVSDVTMPTCYEFTDSGGWLGDWTGRVNSIDADGFTVDDQATDSDPNKATRIYSYSAWG